MNYEEIYFEIKFSIDQMSNQKFNSRNKYHFKNYIYKIHYKRKHQLKNKN